MCSATSSSSESLSASTRAPASAWVLTTSNSAGGEPPGLEQDRVRDGDLADVVQRRRVADVGDRELGQPEPLAEARRERRDALGVLARVVVAVLGREREPPQHLHPQRVEVAPAPDRQRGERGLEVARPALERERSSSARRRRTSPWSSSSGGDVELGGGDERRPVRRSSGSSSSRSSPRPRRGRRSRRAGRRARPGRPPRRPAATVTWAAPAARRAPSARAASPSPPAMSTRVPASASSIIEHHGGTSGPAPRHRDRGLSDRGAHRPRRHGRGLPRPAHEPAAARRDQDHRPGVRRHQGLPHALHPRGADRRRPPAPEHRHGLRRRPVGRDALHRDAVHPRLGPRGDPARGGPAAPLPRDRRLPPDRLGARRRARHGADPPRRQARQRADRGPPRVPHRLRADQALGRRDGRPDPGRRARGDDPLHRAGADRGRPGRRPHRRLLARVPALPLPGRRRPVLPRHRRRRDLRAPLGDAAEALGPAPGAARWGSTR